MKQQEHHLTDEMIAGRRPDWYGRLPHDMPAWMARVIVTIDTMSLWTGRIVAWLTLPLILVMTYEVAARYVFTAPTVWAYDLSRMIFGGAFVLGSAYALSKGVHIRSDFIYRRWSVHAQGWVDTLLYLFGFFPAMIVLLYVSTDWAWVSLSRAERGTDTAWMPLLGPVKSTLPIGVAFLILQGISEVLKSIHAARKGSWPQ